MAEPRCSPLIGSQDDELRVFAAAGTRVKEVSLMGLLLRPRIFISPNTTF